MESLETMICFRSHETRNKSPNDPKLSDRRSGRGTCRWVEKRWWSAAGAVTAEPVRCSAWLGRWLLIGRIEGLKDAKLCSNPLLELLFGDWVVDLRHLGPYA